MLEIMVVSLVVGALAAFVKDLDYAGIMKGALAYFVALFGVSFVLNLIGAIPSATLLGGWASLTVSLGLLSVLIAPLLVGVIGMLIYLLMAALMKMAIEKL